MTRAEMLACMEEIHLLLALRFGRDTVTGEIRTSDGQARSFQGWLGLIAAIERVGCAPAPRSPGRSGQARDGGCDER